MGLEGNKHPKKICIVWDESNILLRTPQYAIKINVIITEKNIQSHEVWENETPKTKKLYHLGWIHYLSAHILKYQIWNNENRMKKKTNFSFKILCFEKQQHQPIHNENKCNDHQEKT